MATNLDQVANVLTNVSVTGASTTTYEIAQITVSEKWLFHSNLWRRVNTGTTPGNITDISFFWTTSADVQMVRLATGALPAVWATATLGLSTQIAKAQEKIRMVVTHSGNAAVDIRTIISAIRIT